MLNNYYVGEFLIMQKKEEVEKKSRSAWMWVKRPVEILQTTRPVVKPICCTAV